MNYEAPAYNITYDIPRISVGMPGKMNRAADGRLKITPGMTEPFQFIWGNMDGVPINLAGLRVKLVFWKSGRIQRDGSPNLTSHGLTVGEVILQKAVDIQDPYAGDCIVVLNSDETMDLRQKSQESGSIRWGLFLINSDGDIFPASVTFNGSRYGSVNFDDESGMPLAEILRQ